MVCRIIDIGLEGVPAALASVTPAQTVTYSVAGSFNGQPAEGNFLISPPGGRLGLNEYTIIYDVGSFDPSADGLHASQVGTASAEIDTLNKAATVRVTLHVNGGEDVQFTGRQLVPSLTPLILSSFTIIGGTDTITFSASPS